MHTSNHNSSIRHRPSSPSASSHSAIGSATETQTIQPRPKASKKVGIYRKVFPRVSETFITEPAEKMERYRPLFITCKQLSKTQHSTVSVSRDDRWGLKQALYLLNRSPKLFKDKTDLATVDLIHSHFGPDGAYAMALAQSLKIPFLVTFHGWDITIDRSVPWKMKSPLYYQLLLHESELKREASIFIAVSKFIEKKLIEKGYPREKIVQHYIGIDTDKFSPQEKPAEERYILCVGRHTEKKGIDTLLKAFAKIAKQYPDVSLIQVGSGDLEPQLKALTATLNIGDQVKFLGNQPYHKVQALMAEAEIFALPSQTAKDGDSEGLPFVVLEAMASGKPVAATWHSGIPEAVTDGETGYLVPEKADQALASALDKLLTQRSVAQAMGRRGREIVCERFNIHTQTRKLESIYDRVLASAK